MNKKEAAQYKKQWDLVNQARVAEVRQMSGLQKLADLELLFEFAERLGPPARTSGAGWEDWSRLKELSDV